MQRDKELNTMQKGEKGIKAKRTNGQKIATEMPTGVGSNLLGGTGNP